ncbi:universal stress protein [Geodermatophilus sp. SYSU D00710]
METTAQQSGIVVGVDGSACAREALAWAGRLAARAGLPLTVVRAWSIPTAPRPATWEPGYVPPMSDYEKAVEQALAHDVAAARVPEGTTVTCRAVHAAPAEAVVAASRGAEMLVVGVRGWGGALGRLGSLAQAVLREAACPVTVVRSGTTPRMEGAGQPLV